MKWSSVQWLGGEWRLSLYVNGHDFHHIIATKWIKHNKYIQEVKMRLIMFAIREGALK